MFDAFFWFDQFCCYMNQGVFKQLISGPMNTNFVDILHVLLIP